MPDSKWFKDTAEELAIAEGHFGAALLWLGAAMALAQCGRVAECKESLRQVGDMLDKCRADIYRTEGNVLANCTN